MRTKVVGNPITEEAYVLIDTPRDPPPPMSLGFEPERPYMPSMSSPIDAVRDRLPELIERGLGLVDTAENILARLSTTLDKFEAFFTNADRILRESELPSSAKTSNRLPTSSKRSLAKTERSTAFSRAREKPSTSRTFRKR
jgi:hypothetical protein